MDDLFEQKNDSHAPLAERMRPETLRDFVGQKHLLAQGKPLRKMIESGKLQSMILWGPPGSGKTSLARLISHYCQADFEQFSAVTAGVADVRRITQKAGENLKFYRKKTILFVDEIHRFNKAQQDAFLPFVENGTIILIGATTENPGFEINAPLISRSQVFVLNALADREILTLIKRAKRQYYVRHQLADSAMKYLAKITNGDARVAINALEIAASLSNNITLEIAREAVQKKAIYYDKKGGYHYDTISAFIKSLRGSDPDAALYWLARMLKAGEDPMFIARRMVILASEDIGNAQPNALVLATSCMQAVHLVGMPEAQIILSQTATYLAGSPKSNAAYLAIGAALKAVDEERLEPVPIHLRNVPAGCPVRNAVQLKKNKPTSAQKLAKELDYGKEYLYPHDFGGYVKQDYLPKNLIGKKFYFPKNIGKEKEIKKWLEELRELRKQDQEK